MRSASLGSSCPPSCLLAVKERLRLGHGSAGQVPVAGHGCRPSWLPSSQLCVLPSRRDTASASGPTVLTAISSWALVTCHFFVQYRTSRLLLRSISLRSSSPVFFGMSVMLQTLLGQVLRLHSRTSCPFGEICLDFFWICHMRM